MYVCTEELGRVVNAWETFRMMPIQCNFFDQVKHRQCGKMPWQVMRGTAGSDYSATLLVWQSRPKHVITFLYDSRIIIAEFSLCPPYKGSPASVLWTDTG